MHYEVVVYKVSERETSELVLQELTFSLSLSLLSPVRMFLQKLFVSSLEHRLQLHHLLACSFFRVGGNAVSLV